VQGLQPLCAVGTAENSPGVHSWEDVCAERPKCRRHDRTSPPCLRHSGADATRIPSVETLGSSRVSGASNFSLHGSGGMGPRLSGWESLRDIPQHREFMAIRKMRADPCEPETAFRHTGISVSVGEPHGSGRRVTRPMNRCRPSRAHRNSRRPDPPGASCHDSPDMFSVLPGLDPVGFISWQE
jgi:hypothetical protein